MWVPFRTLPRFYSTRPAFQLSLTSLLSTYRNTGFTLQDGQSEWKGQGGLLFLEQENKLLGMLQMKRSRTFWELSSFAVNPQHQGFGYGKQMLQYALDHADAPVCLRVKQENPAQQLYDKLGFEKECHSDGRYFMKFQTEY